MKFRKILAVLITATMLMSLFPTITGVAAPGESDSVVFTKTLVDSAAGQPKRIKLEAYTTGSATSSSEHFPADIVLVLDQSGSMDDTVGGQTKLELMKDTVSDFAGEVANFNANNDDTYRLAIVGFASESGNGNNTEILTAMSSTTVTSSEYVRVTDITTLDTDETYYIQDGDDYRRIKYFEADDGDPAGWYTYSMFFFWTMRDEYINIQSTAIYDYTQVTSDVQTQGVTYTSLGEDDYASALINCTDTNIAEDGMIYNAIAALDGNGATRTDLGVQIAEAIFKAQPDGTYDGRKKIVLVITDGVPTTQSSFSTSVANAAVSAALRMKADGTDIFSMYIGTPSNDSVSFLQALSSNYPDATEYDSLGDQAAESYYSAHTDASAITGVFHDIVYSIIADSQLNARSVITDTISENFRLPVVSGGVYNPDQITVYTVEKTESDWADEEVPFNMATVTIEDGKTIKITGFNFAYHCVTEVPKVVGGTDYGRKLVIYIPIVEDESADTFGGYLPTNDGAGIYLDSTAPRPVKTAENGYSNVGLDYILYDAEHWVHIGTETEYEFIYNAQTMNPILDEMIIADYIPDGTNNLGVNMRYAIYDTNLNSGGDEPGDVLIATLEVEAGESIDVTAFENWTLEPGIDKNTLVIGDNNSAEAMYVLACRLTNINDTGDTLLQYSQLDVQAVNDEVHIVGGVIDNGGTISREPSDRGEIIENTYRESVADGDDSAEMIFELKPGYEFARIVKRTSADAPLDTTTVLYDVANGINDVAFEGDGTYKYKEEGVTSGIAIEVYTRLKEFTLTTASDATSEIIDGTTYTYSGSEVLEAFFAAHTGYYITSVMVGETQSDAVTYTAAELLADPAPIDVNLETALDHNGDTIIIDGDVHLPRTQDNYVEVTSAKRSFNLTYKYYRKDGSTYTELGDEDAPAVEYGASLPTPANMPGDETTIDGDTYTLRGWYRTHSGTEFYGLTDITATNMPAADLILHAFWEKNPDIEVELPGIKKVLNNSAGEEEAFGEEVTFNFIAVMNEQQLPSDIASVTLDATESEKTLTMTVIMTDAQYDRFEAGTPVYLYEVRGSDNVWIYDNARYAIYYGDSALTIKDRANADVTEIVFENQQAPYLVSYDLDGGLINESRTVVPNIVDFADADLLPAEEPHKDGYTFECWKLGATEVGEETTYSSLVENDRSVTGITLVAQYSENEYTVAYDLNGGKISGSATYPDNTVTWTESGLLPPENPTRSGYNFTGWKKDTMTVNNEMTYAEVVNGDSGTEEITLQAQWTPSGGGGGGTLRYTLTYETNGGSEIAKETHNSGTTVKLEKKPERDGYIFDKWYSDKELTKPIEEVRMIRNTTVYAGWIEDNGNAGNGHDIPGSLNGDEHFAYVIGYPDDTVRPNNNITRAEVTSIFFRLLKEEIRNANLTSENAFDDVNVETWYNTAISTMGALGVIEGRNDEWFDPDAFITRAEFAAICARFDDSEFEVVDEFTDVAGHWAEDEIHEAAAHGWIRGYDDNTFKPNQYITRAEAMTMINRVLNRVPENIDDLLDDMIKWTDNSDTDAWYYIAVQEATNSHDFTQKNKVYEKWTKITEVTDWEAYE